MAKDHVSLLSFCGQFGSEDISEGCWFSPRLSFALLDNPLMEGTLMVA